MEKPQIYQYVSPLSYLEDTYKFRKRKDPSFSFERWSEELGFKSRSFLKMLIMGERKITGKFIETYAAKNKFPASEKDFFSIITAYHQSEAAPEKSLFLQKIFEARGLVRDLTLIENETEFLSSPLIPHLQTLLSFKDVEKTAENLADLLGAPVTEISHLLEVLEKMDLLDEEKSFRVGIRLGSQALRKYHDYSLQEAMRAQDLPTDQRRYRSLILPLNEAEYAELLEHIKAFASHNLAKYEADQLNERRLYKLNLNVYPISKKHKSST